MNCISTLDNITHWQLHPVSDQQAVQALESGQVLYMPRLAFNLQADEHSLLTPEVLAKNRKNVSYDYSKRHMSGCSDDPAIQSKLTQMMHRFAIQAQQLIDVLLPEYHNHLTIGRTSFRPQEIAGRKAPSFRKDDTRLHVDAFPSTPMQGRRILRVFSNINPQNQPRKWRIGERFPEVVKRFLPSITAPQFGSRKLMHWFKITRRYRTLYDHYMLRLHDQMKKDIDYQKSAHQQSLMLAAGSTWLVYTDIASHAVDQGQHALEQTFYLPVDAMHDPKQSPLKILEKFLEQRLK